MKFLKFCIDMNILEALFSRWGNIVIIQKIIFVIVDNIPCLFFQTDTTDGFTFHQIPETHFHFGK